MASVLAADQGKVLSVQIQFTQPGLAAINRECGGTKWRRVLAEFAKECAVRQICQICSAHLDSVSVADDHLLETHAQQYYIRMASDDPRGLIYQFYSVATVSTLDLSVLNVDILQDTPRVLVVTLTMLTADLDGTAESHTLTVCSGRPPQRCVLLCVTTCMGVMMK